MGCAGGAEESARRGAMQGATSAAIAKPGSIEQDQVRDGAPLARSSMPTSLSLESLGARSTPLRFFQEQFSKRWIQKDQPSLLPLNLVASAGAVRGNGYEGVGLLSTAVCVLAPPLVPRRVQGL